MLLNTCEMGQRLKPLGKPFNPLGQPFFLSSRATIYTLGPTISNQTVSNQFNAGANHFNP